MTSSRFKLALLLLLVCLQFAEGAEGILVLSRPYLNEASGAAVDMIAQRVDVVKEDGNLVLTAVDGIQLTKGHKGRIGKVTIQADGKIAANEVLHDGDAMGLMGVLRKTKIGYEGDGMVYYFMDREYVSVLVIASDPNADF